MLSKKMQTKKSVSKHSNNTNSTAKASVNSSPMNSEESHSVEYCVGCRDKVKVSDITHVEFKGKGKKTRHCMVGTCEHGHKWQKFVANKTKTIGKGKNETMTHKGGTRKFVGGAGQQKQPPPKEKQRIVNKINTNQMEYLGDTGKLRLVPNYNLPL